MIKLIAEEKCCRTTITFNEHNQEKEDQYLADFKRLPRTLVTSVMR